VARCGELTDTAWDRLMPLLPKNGHSGKQWRDHRQVIDGILWRLCTLARCARPLRPLANLLRSVCPLASRWHLGPGAGPRPNGG